MSVYNVKDSHPDHQGIPQPGAQGDGITNDRAAIQRAIDAAASAGGGVVLFPPGTYLITYLADTVYAGLHVKSNITLVGSGVSNTTISQALPNGPNLTLIYGILNDSITIRDLTLNGGQASEPSDYTVVQHCHGIRLESCSKVWITNVAILNCGGDGVAIQRDNNAPPSADIFVENCTFETIWRIGITAVEHFKDILIRACTFRNYKSFALKAELHSDFPDDDTLDRGLTMTRCTCLPATLTGQNTSGSVSIYGPYSQLFRDVNITHNILRGTVRFRGVHHTVFDGNTVLHTGSAEDAALDLWGNVVDFAARHNTLRVERGLGFRAWSSNSDGYPDVDPNRELVFSYNTVEWISSSPPVYNPPPMTPPLFEGRAVALHSAQDAVVEGNILRGAKPGATAWPVELPALQVALRNPAHTQGGQPPPPQRITLTHNLVEGYPIGIQLHDPATTQEQTLTDLVVAHNVLDRCVKGIELNRAERLERLVLSGHVVVQPPTGSASLVWNGTSLPPYLIGGVHGQDALAVGFFVGQGAPGSSPEPRVQSAAVGSLYLDSTPSGGRLWVRQKSGGTPQWTAL